MAVDGTGWLVTEEKFFSVWWRDFGAWRGRGVIKFSGFSGTPWPDGSGDGDEATLDRGLRLLGDET
jgi:hypothetical protein